MSTRWADANQRFNAAYLHRITALLAFGPCAPVQAIADELRERESLMERPPAIVTLREAFGLSCFEQDLVMLCAGVALDDSVRKTLADGRGEEARHSSPTFGLALATLPEAHWTAFTPASPLRRWSLIERGPGQVITECPST